MCEKRVQIMRLKELQCRTSVTNPRMRLWWFVGILVICVKDLKFGHGTQISCPGERGLLEARCRAGGALALRRSGGGE